MGTDPISTNQVIEVGLFKPKCATFKGNGLNDWLQWLAETECAVDWKNLDVACLTSYIDNCPVCEQDQKKVIILMRDAICKLITEVKTLSPNTPIDTLLITDNNLVNNWKTFTGSQVRLAKEGKLVNLSGLINLGTLNTVCYTLPVGYRPVVQQKFIGLYTVSPFFTHITVATTGDITITIPSGVVGVVSSGNHVALDGIQFATA
jgi:hypothetical protein